MKRRTLGSAAPALAALVLALLALALWPGAASAASATLTVQTVPRLQGARIFVDGRAYVTGANGFVAIPTSSGMHVVRAEAPSSRRGLRMRFARWLDGSVARQRVMTLAAGRNREQAAFVLSRPVALALTDPTGHPVSLSEVGGIELTSSQGERIVFDPPRPRARFDVNYLVRKPDGLVSLPIRYRVQAVTMRGANVVHEGSQSFFVGNGGTWTIAALVFPLKIEVRDAFFGFGIGHAVRLVSPDGSSRTLQLGGDHVATVAGLPRGLYKLVPQGPGFGLSSPTALSRPQVADLLIFSWVDVAAVAAFALLFVVGLPLLGGRLVRRRGSRLPAWRSSAREGEPVVAEQIVEGTGAGGGEADAEGVAPDIRTTAPIPRLQGRGE